MFRCFLLPAAVILGCILSAGHSVAQEKGGSEPPPPPQETPDGSSTSPSIPLPYPEGKTLVYLWMYKGEEVGKTELSWERMPGPKEGGKAQIRLRANLRYSARGRRIVSSTQTDLDAATLTPVAFRQDFSLEALGRWTSGQTVVAELGGGLGRISVKVKGSEEVSNHEVALSEPIFLYESQAVEHWALFTPSLSARGGGTYSFLAPSEHKIRKITFRKEREEVQDDRRLRRWSVTHPAFQALLWTTEDGRFHHYQQGDLEIRFFEGGS
ncbi:MAG: hypothetical protein ACE5GW_06885 [Planctomycetota bacterium]